MLHTLGVEGTKAAGTVGGAGRVWEGLAQSKEWGITKAKRADLLTSFNSMWWDVNHNSSYCWILLPTNKLRDPFCRQSVLANCENNKELGSLDVMKINQWQLPLSHSVSYVREIANYIARIFKIKANDLRKEIMTLQTVMVQLKVRLAQPDCWSLVAENENTCFWLQMGF